MIKFGKVFRFTWMQFLPNCLHILWQSIEYFQQKKCKRKGSIVRVRFTKRSFVQRNFQATTRPEPRDAVNTLRQCWRLNFHGHLAQRNTKVQYAKMKHQSMSVFLAWDFKLITRSQGLNTKSAQNNRNASLSKGFLRTFPQDFQTWTWERFPSLTTAELHHKRQRSNRNYHKCCELSVDTVLV